MAEYDLPGHLSNLNKEQAEMLQAFWAIIRQHPDSKLMEEFWIQIAIDDLDVLLLRFLRARKWDLGAASCMLLQSMHWRQHFQVQQLLLQGESSINRASLESGKGFFWGLDRQGRPVAYFRPRFHDWRKQAGNETCRHIIYQTEIGRRLFPKGAETLTVVFDMRGLTTWSMDLACAKFVITTFQEHYPESLGPCLIINAPFIFYSFYSLIKGCICAEVRGKIRFLDDATELLEYIAPEMLLKEFGGLNDYEYEYIPPPKVDKTTTAEDEALITRLQAKSQEIIEQIKRTDDRKELLPELKKIYQKIDGLTMPLNLYHRLGVLKKEEETGEDRVDWSVV